MAEKKVALVIAHNNYQPTEYAETKKALEAAGIDVDTVSDEPGIATATDQSTTLADYTIAEANLDEIDGLVFIGGPDALQHLDHARSHELLEMAHKRGMPIGAICLSVRILAKSDILATKKATGWDGDNTLGAIFRQHNVTRVDQPVVVDESIITATGPDAASLFGSKIATLIHKK